MSRKNIVSSRMVVVAAGLVAGASYGASGVSPVLADHCPIEGRVFNDEDNHKIADPDEENIWYGEGGKDYLDVNDCGDYVRGGQGDDTLGGDSGHDELYGGVNGVGEEVLRGGHGGDFLYGNEDWDDLDDDASSDTDRLHGGNGPDDVDTADDDMADGAWGGDGNNDRCHVNERNGAIEYVDECESLSWTYLN